MWAWKDQPSRTGPWVPVAVFIAVACWLYLPHLLFQGPSGFHFIRQTDSYSFSQRFGHPSWNFFAPAVHDLRSCPDGGAAAAEFPVLYYLDALLRESVGLPFSLLRLMGLSFVITGHVLLARLASRWLDSVITGTAFSLWMFSSTIVVYYGANYLPDAAVYGCVLIGSCLAARSYLDRNKWFSVPAVLFLTLAGLLKAPASFYLLTYVIAGLYLQWKQNIPSTTRSTYGPLAAAFVMIIGWHAFAIRSNAAHHTMYFMTWAEPLWAMPAKEISDTWGYVWHHWWSKYHHPATWHVLSVLVLFVLWRAGRYPRATRLVLLLLVMGGSAFMVLFFRKLRDHDYYFLTIAPVIIALALAGSTRALDLLKGRWKHVLTAVFLGLGTAGLVLARMNLVRRYDTRADMFNAALVIGRDMPRELERLGIPRSSRFIVVGDPTPNGSLSLLDREGWPYADTERVDIPYLVRSGADHLLIIGERAQVDTTDFSTILAKKEVRLMRLLDH